MRLIRPDFHLVDGGQNDCRIVCKGGKVLHSNRLLMVQWSEVFRRALLTVPDGWTCSDGTTSTVLLPDVDARDMRKILVWSSRGQVMLTGHEDVKRLLAVLHLLEVSVKVNAETLINSVASTPICELSLQEEDEEQLEEADPLSITEDCLQEKSNSNFVKRKIAKRKITKVSSGPERALEMQFHKMPPCSVRLERCDQRPSGMEVAEVPKKRQKPNSNNGRKNRVTSSSQRNDGGDKYEIHCCPLCPQVRQCRTWKDMLDHISSAHCGNSIMKDPAEHTAFMPLGCHWSCPICVRPYEEAFQRSDHLRAAVGHLRAPHGAALKFLAPETVEALKRGMYRVVRSTGSDMKMCPSCPGVFSSKKLLFHICESHYFKQVEADVADLLAASLVDATSGLSEAYQAYKCFLCKKDIVGGKREMVLHLGCVHGRVGKYLKPPLRAELNADDLCPREMSQIIADALKNSFSKK